MSNARVVNRESEPNRSEWESGERTVEKRRDSINGYGKSENSHRLASRRHRRRHTHVGWSRAVNFDSGWDLCWWYFMFYNTFRTRWSGFQNCSFLWQQSVLQICANLLQDDGFFQPKIAARHSLDWMGGHQLLGKVLISACQRPHYHRVLTSTNYRTPNWSWKVGSFPTYQLAACHVLENRSESPMYTQIDLFANINKIISGSGTIYKPPNFASKHRL